MELPVIVHELRTLYEEYKKRLTDKEPATVVYCNGFCSILQKFLDKHNGSYEEYVFSLCIFLCHYAASYGELAIDNAKEKICQQLFRLCIKAVLDVKWKELSEDNTCRQKFRETVDAVHTQLERFDFYQFQLIKTLMETHWDHPTLSRIMAGADDLEEHEVMEYFAEEDPIVLKVRVEMLLDENCEEFALNLCKWCCLHPALVDNVEIRETQLFMLYRTGNVDKMQEECAKISSEMAVQIIKNLQECEAQQSFCVMIAQTFLVQNWVRGLSADSGTKTLLKLWIRLQYLVDGDLDKFSDSIWAIAKLSQHTEQITFLVEALREEAGDTFLQLNTNLCIYAFNLDKGCLEQAVADKDMELILCRNVALSKTSQMIMNLYHGLCPKLAKLSAVTAFALDPSEENFEIVYTIFHFANHGLLSSNSITSQHEDNLLDSNSPNKFVNKLTNMLDSLHVSPTKETKRLRPKTKTERNRHSMSHRTVDNVEYCGLSVNPATLYEVERLLNNICPFHLDIEINFTDLRNICMEHLTRHQEMLMVLHEESTDECSEYSSFDDEQADRARVSGDLIDLPDNAASELPLDIDNSTQKLDGCVVTEYEQEVGDAKCMCSPSLDAISQKSCQSLFEANSVKYNTTKMACHSNQTCPNSVSSRNLFDAFNRDLSSKACSSQQDEQYHLTVDMAKTSNMIDKEVGYCANISEKTARFLTCGASPAGNCKCDKSLSVHTCLSFDSQIDFSNMMDNVPIPSAPHTLHSIEKSSSSITSKLHKMRVRDEHCCCNSLPSTVNDGNTVHVPTSLKCMCKIKGKSTKKSDKSLKCDKKLQQVPESNNNETQSKSSGHKIPAEDFTANDKLLEKLKSCISAQTGSDSCNVNEKFTLSKMEKSYIDRYCQFLKTVRQFEMAMLTQKSCKPSTKQKRNYLVVYRCGICCEFFDQVSDLKEHIQSICKAAVMDMKNLTEAASIFCTKDSVLSKIKFFKCLKCLQYTCTRREMDDHLRLCGVPLAKKSSKTTGIASPVHKVELHKPSLGNLFTSTDSLQMIENNNNNVSLVKTENDPISDVLPSISDSAKIHLCDEEGMSAESNCKKLDASNIEMNSKVKCPEENVDKNIKPKVTNEEYFKCQMCGRLLLGPHRHRLHLEACKKRCEWRKDRRLKRMSLAKPSEKARSLIKKEITITSSLATTLSTTTSNATVKELPMSGINKMSISTSKDNLSNNSVHSNVVEPKNEIKPKPPIPQPEKPKHCPDCERIIKLRKVSQQLGISEKMLIKTEPQEISNRQTQVLHPSSKQSNSESHPVMSESEVDAAATAATAAVVAAAAADLQMETTNTQAINDKMNTDECIKRTMLQIKSEMENKQLMKKKVESQHCRILNSVSNLLPTSSVPRETFSNKLIVNSGCNVSNTTQNSDMAKCKIGSFVKGHLRKRSVGGASPYCRKCDLKFRNRSDFVKHLAITHLQPYTKEKIPDPDSNTVIFHCNFCQGAFQVWFKYINHIPNHSALILERLNCKLVEETYSVADEKPFTSSIDLTGYSDKNDKANHSKTHLKKTHLKLVWPPPEEDIGTFFKRKRRRGTHKSRRTARHNIPHPNPSLGNLSKTTIMNFTQTSSDADDSTKKEILQVMNDLLQKIVGSNEQDHNIMDVGSMPKSVTEKRKTVSLPVHSISSSCPNSNPISNVAASAVVPFPSSYTTDQSCTKEMTGYNAKISASAVHNETPTIVLEKVIKTQQKGEISTAAASLYCPLQKLSDEGKLSIQSVSHSSKNSASMQSCLTSVNVLEKNESICSFNKGDISLKDLVLKANFDSCSKNASIKDKDQDRNPIITSDDKRKDGCSNLKTCNTKLENSEDKCSGKNKEVSLFSQQVDAVKKNDFSDTTTKMMQDKLESTCLHSSLFLPILCKPSFPHFSCVSPSLSAPDTPSASLLIPEPAYISNKFTSQACVSLTMPVTTPHVTSVPTSESVPTTISKSASSSVVLFTSSARDIPSSTALLSMCTHIPEPLINTQSCTVSSSRSHPAVTYKSVSFDPSSSAFANASPSSSFVTLQSFTSFVQTTTTTTAATSDNCISSSLSLCPNSPFTSTNVLSSITANSVPPYSICVCTVNLSSASLLSKPVFTATPIQMHQTFTTGPTPSTCITISNPLSTIRDSVSTSNANSVVSISSGAVNMASMSFTPPVTTINLSTVSVSSVKAPILSTSLSFKPANISVASSTSNITCQNLYSTDNTEALSSKSVISESNLSSSLKPKTLSADISKITENQLNLGSNTITNVNTTETIKQTASTTLGSSTVEMYNNLIDTSVEKPTSALNIVSTEATTGLKSTAITKSADLNTTFKTISTVCSMMQSNTGIISLQSSTVPNMVSTQPFDTTTMQSTTNLSLQSTALSSDVPNPTVLIQPPSIFASDNCSINNLALPSAVNSNTITAISESLTSVVKAPSNVSTNTAFTLPTSNVSLSSSLASSLSNNSVGSAFTNSTTCFQMNPSVRSSVSGDPSLSIASANLAFPATYKSSVITVSANTSTITVSKPASSVCTIKTCVTLEKPTVISSTTSATSKVYASSTSTIEDSKSSAISLNKTCATVSVANSSFLASKTVTSKSAATVSSSKTLMTTSKPSTSIAASILTASSKPVTIVSPAKNSHSTLKVSPSIITTVSKCATTVATSKTSTTASTTIVPKTTSAVSASSAAIETLKLSTISKSKISNIVSKTTPTISTAALIPLSSVSTTLTSISKSPTVNISESSCSSGVLVNSIEVTKSSNERPLMYYTQKSSQGNCEAFSYVTATEKAYKCSTTAIDTTESIVSSFSAPSTPETTTPLSTAAFNSSTSFSLCTFTTSSLSTTSTVTFVTSTITPTVSSSTSAIKQSMNKSDNDQIIAPIADMLNLAPITISSQVNKPVQPLTKETSVIKTESVHCSGVDSVSKLSDDCTKLFCISEGDKLKTKPLNDSKLMITSQHSGMPDIEKKEPNISCQSRTSLYCSQTVKHLISNAEDFCSNTIVTPKCEIEAKNIDPSPLSNVKTSSNYAFEHFSCNKGTETENCDVKLSTAYENMSCNLMNPTCEEVTVTYNNDNPVSLSVDCKFDCNQENTESCEKESLYFNDVKAKYKEVLENSSDSCSSSPDGIKEGLTYKIPQSSRSNEGSREGMNEDAIYETYSSIDKKTAEYRGVAILKSQNSTNDSDKQCKKQWPVKVASEVLSEVDDSKSSTKTKCQDKEKIHAHAKQLRRPRGRPRKTNTELLLSSVASRQKLLNPGNIINFRLRKDRPTLKTTKCRYCCCKKRCQISCVQNKCKSCIAESTSACRCNLSESQLNSMQKVALSNSTMCLNCHSNNKRASRVSKRKRSPSPKPIRRRSHIHSPLRSSSVSNQKTSSNTRLQKISNVPFKKKLSNSPHKSVVGSPHKKSLAGSHKKMTGVNLKKLSNDYRKQKQFELSSDKNLTEEFSKESSIISLKSGSSDSLQDTKNVSNLATRRTLRSRKSLDEATPVIRQLRRSKSEQKLDSCTGDISKKQTELLSVDNANGTLINYKLSQNISVENKTNVPLSCCNSEEDCCKVCTENVGKKFVGNRALKELRQRVKLGPFKWDLEESETGGRAHSMPEDDECTVSTTDITTTSATNLVMSKDIKVSTLSSLHTSHLSMPSSPASSPFPSSPSATADDELLGTGVTPPIRTYSRTQSPPSRIRVGRTYSKASDYQALPPGVMPVMPIIDCLRPTSHSSASHLCDMPRVHVVRVDKKGNMFETREPYPLPRNPLDLDMGRNVVDDEKGGGHRWKLQRTKMKTDGYPFSFKKTRIQ